MNVNDQVVITYNSHRGVIQTDNDNGMFWVYDHVLLRSVLVTEINLVKA